MKIGNILWTEFSRYRYGFKPGWQFRVTLLPRLRDDLGNLMSTADFMITYASGNLSVVKRNEDGWDPMSLNRGVDPFHDSTATANAECILDAN